MWVCVQLKLALALPNWGKVGCFSRPLCCWFGPSWKFTQSTFSPFSFFFYLSAKAFPYPRTHTHTHTHTPREAMAMATTLTGPKTLMWHQQMRGEAERGKPMAPTALRLSVCGFRSVSVWQCACASKCVCLWELVNPLTLAHTRTKRKCQELASNR